MEWQRAGRKGTEMNSDEFFKFTAALKTYYPRECLLPNDEALGLWFQELKDIPYPIAETALRKWVNTSKWSPTIADIREFSFANANGEQADYGEAWQEVMKSIQRWGMYREEQALENMDPLTKQVVQRLGFRSICTSENITADRANFRMIFEELSSREKTNKQVPQKLREQIEQIRNAGMQKIESKGE